MLTAVLLALALMQYHWSGAVSDAATARMRASLSTSMMSFRQDFYRQLSDLLIATQPDQAPSATGLIRYANQLQQWHRSAANSEMVKSVYVWQSMNGKPKASQFNLTTGRLETAETLPHLPILANDSFFHMHFRGPGPVLLRHQEGMMMMQRRPESGGPPHRFGALWILDPSIPALLRPISFESGSNDSKIPDPSPRWIVIELNRDFLRQRLFPQLAARYFSGANGLEYDVAVIAEGHQQEIYSSGGNLSNNPTGADASIHLFGPPGRPPAEVGVAFVGKDQVRVQTEPIQMGDAGREPAEPVHFMTMGGDWRLIVKNKQGSLEAAVAGFRRKHLAISFGVLLVLALTMGIVVVAGRRAQQLADLQMEFVAGVSHELRTPLAVITSAADNIFDGVVAERAQLERYAGVIKNQARQLTQLIEQILLFAIAREKKQQFKMRRLQVSELIDAALESTAELAHSARSTVQKDVPADLPAIVGDFDDLLHCLQNLITNAIKYGGQSGSLAVRAASADSSREVRVVVEDKGLGISAAELSKIFDPFYRSPSVIAAQIHGTGLGLPLARSIAEAMGGRITVSSQIGKGSAFTLHFPAASEVAETSMEKSVADVMKTAGSQ